MILQVIFIPSKGNPINGILLKREGVMLEVAFDETLDRNFSIGYINPTNQAVRIQSAEGARWKHPAMRLIASGNIEEARKIYYQEEAARKLARLKKEGSV